MQDRVEALEKKLERASDTHKEFYDRIRALEMAGAVQSERYDTIIDKLDSLTATVAEITAKPGKRWDSVVEKILLAVAGAAVAFVLAKFGL